MAKGIQQELSAVVSADYLLVYDFLNVLKIGCFWPLSWLLQQDLHAYSFLITWSQGNELLVKRTRQEFLNYLSQ